MIKIIKENPVSTSYITDVDTYIIPNVSEDDADKIINFAFRSDAVEDCVWNSGKIEITCDSFIFRMILIWAYRKGFISGNMRIGDILRDNGIDESYRQNKLKRRLREQDVEIEVKHEGILEVPEGKNVDDLPVSHFVNLAKKKGLSKITKALNNLQVWNKKKNPSLSKWAGDMIDKVSKKMEKKESLKRLKEDSLDDFVRPEIKKRYIWPLYTDSAYDISEIVEKYQNTNRFKNEIKSFDLKDISYMDWPALQLEIECSNEAYVLIRKDIEREGLYMDDDDECFDESLKEDSWDTSNPYSFDNLESDAKKCFKQGNYIASDVIDRLFRNWYKKREIYKIIMANLDILDLGKLDDESFIEQEIESQAKLY